MIENDVFTASNSINFVPSAPGSMVAPVIEALCAIENMDSHQIQISEPWDFEHQNGEVAPNVKTVSKKNKVVSVSL